MQKTALVVCMGLQAGPSTGGSPWQRSQRLALAEQLVKPLERATREGDSPVGERVNPSGAVPK